MAILYRSNPMPTGGALFVTNPKRKKPSVRVNRDQFAKYIAKKKRQPKKWRKYREKQFMRSKEYRDLRQKYLPQYMSSKNRNQRLIQQRISRSTAKSAFSGDGKREAKASAIKQLMKSPLNLTRPEASKTFDQLYQSPKTISKRKTSSSRTQTVSRGNPMTKTAKRAAAAKKLKGLIRSKRLLSHAKFRSLYKGCGHSPKAVSRMYKKYKNEVLKGKAGYAPGLGRIGSAKKRKPAKRKRSTAKRKPAKRKTSGRKTLSAYQRFLKSQKGKGLTMKQMAAKWRKKGHTHKHKKSAKKSHSHKHSHRKSTRSHAHKHKKAAKRGSSFGQLGITLRRLGYTSPLSSKTLNTVTKRRAKIKALRAKGATMKKYEGVKRAKPRGGKRRASSKSQNLWVLWLREAKVARSGKSSRWSHDEAKKNYKKYKDRMTVAVVSGKKTKLQAVKSVIKQVNARGGYFLADTPGKIAQFGKLIANPAELIKTGVLQPVLGLMDVAEGLVGNVPIVGNVVAPFTKPILLGAGMGALSFYTLKKFGPEIHKVPYVGSYLEKGAYTVGGGAIAMICMIGTKLGLFNPDNASLVASAAVLSGAAIDVHDHLLGLHEVPEMREINEQMDAYISASPEEDSEAEYIVQQMEETVEDDSLGAIHLGAINLGGYGDGGAYVIGSGSRALGALNLGAVHLGHAAHAPADFSVKEGQALVQGPDAFNQVAAQPGPEGKRWAWLVKLIGFDNTQELAKLPPRKRLIVLRKLKRNAQAYASSLLSSAPAAPSQPHLPSPDSSYQSGGLEAASLPIAGAANCPGGVQGLGYGALMLAGSGY